MTTVKTQKCKINFANYEDWRFVYGYESNGQDVFLDVTVVNGEDDIEFHLNGKSIGLTPQDFVNCDDIDDCSLIIAKHLIKDNDGVVLTTFVNPYCRSLTGIHYEKQLSKNLEYFTEEKDKCWQITLSTNRYININSYDYTYIPSEDVRQVLDMIIDNDINGLNRYMYEYGYNTNEVLNLWGEDTMEKLEYEVLNEQSEVVDYGCIPISTLNIFDYNDDVHYRIVDNDNHPEYVLIQQDSMKRSYATFTVPKDFKIEEIHFADRYIVPQNYILDWDRFGDYMTTIGVFKYRGELYYSDDYGDSGNWGEQHIGLFKWGKEKKRYDLLAETK